MKDIGIWRSYLFLRPVFFYEEETPFATLLASVSTVLSFLPRLGRVTCALGYFRIRSWLTELHLLPSRLPVEGTESAENHVRVGYASASISVIQWEAFWLVLAMARKSV